MNDNDENKIRALNAHLTNTRQRHHPSDLHARVSPQNFALSTVLEILHDDYFYIISSRIHILGGFLTLNQ